MTLTLSLSRRTGRG